MNNILSQDEINTFKKDGAVFLKGMKTKADSATRALDFINY